MLLPMLRSPLVGVALLLVGGCALTRSGTGDGAESTSSATTAAGGGGSGGGSITASSSTTSTGDATTTTTTTTAAGTGGAGGTNDTWWDASYTRRVRLTFDKLSSPEDLDGFPVLVELDATRIDYAMASATGDDVRFVDADGVTVLPYEIERWVSPGSSSVWVRVPRIDGGSTSDHIWLYYASPGAQPGQDATAVWAGFAGVYHLSGDPNAASIPDSTGAENGTPQGNLSGGDQVAGRVAGAFNLDGNDFVQLADSIDAFDLAPGTARTVETWFLTATKDRHLLSQEASCRGWSVAITATGSVAGRLFLDPDNSGCPAAEVDILPSPLATYADGNWHQAVVVYDRPAGSMRLHMDGAEVATMGIDNTIEGAGFYNRIGTNYDNTKGLDGRIDEVRVSTVARSGAWIAAQYASMTDQCVSFGMTELVP
jgi:hypothetical protein